jgi:glutamate N-acetyltransferase/amino-acid N-acetyltransferase
MSVTGAAGFSAAALAAGLKSSGKPICSGRQQRPGFRGRRVFTRNRVRAAPVLWSEQVLADGQLRAVILNSGGANACTGPTGSPIPTGPRNWWRTGCRK